MENIKRSLEKFGFSEKEILIYIALLSSGPSSIRKIAEKAGINRGTTHSALKTLQKEGLISYYHQEKRQHFVAEDPKIFINILKRKKMEIENTENDLKKILPELDLLSQTSGNRPVVKFYENYSGIRTILEDALNSVEKEQPREYVAYSSSTISPFLYHQEAFPDFTEERIKRKIFVRTIASGPGGSVHGQDERKWITKKESAPIYTLIYGGKVAMISVGKNNIPHGLIIEDLGIYKTELLIFNSLWKSL